ncbi:dienelactone hydrolase family protein [Tsukamurella pseudospumae]|uniref:dienelactone hydrolase family protein n=1 Tax=Tsukamurella pseudospumae TaxID=239498 RepID=UPI001C3077B6|nr:dienelactone hydrolase family protein [Tsukamurella pseudospumae]
MTTAGGVYFSALEAIPVERTGANIVILPDIRGTHPYYAALAERFAQVGHAAIVIDYYGRTAGPGTRGSDFVWKPHFEQVNQDDVADDVAAAIDHLDSEEPGPTFVVGFCFGGGQAWRLAASDLALSGVVGFYGLPGPARAVVDEIRLPMLLLLAGEDVATTTEQFADLTAALDAAGVDFEEHTYDGAPHSFFDSKYEQWRDACEDAWTRTMSFLERHSHVRASA